MTGARFDAAVHDSQELEVVLDPGNAADDVWADSAYRIEDFRGVTDWIASKAL